MEVTERRAIVVGGSIAGLFMAADLLSDMPSFIRRVCSGLQ
jgi:hypothetical protein